MFSFLLIAIYLALLSSKTLKYLVFIAFAIVFICSILPLLYISISLLPFVYITIALYFYIIITICLHYHCSILLYYYYHCSILLLPLLYTIACTINSILNNSHHTTLMTHDKSDTRNSCYRAVMLCVECWWHLVTLTHM